MLSQIRGRHHVVVAYLALFLALGGSAIAAKPLIDGSDVRDESLTGADVQNNTLTGADLDEATLGQVPLAANADQLDGQDSTDFLAADAKAADADKLDGRDSTEFLRGAFGVIAADGSLLAGRGIEVTHLETNASGGPVYSIGFAEDLTQCSIQLTVVDPTKHLFYADIPDGTASGTFLMDHVYPVYEPNVDSGIMVRTRDKAGAVVTRPFQVAAIC